MVNQRDKRVEHHDGLSGSQSGQILEKLSTGVVDERENKKGYSLYFES